MWSCGAGDGDAVLPVIRGNGPDEPDEGTNVSNRQQITRRASRRTNPPASRGRACPCPIRTLRSIRERFGRLFTSLMLLIESDGIAIRRGQAQALNLSTFPRIAPYYPLSLQFIVHAP